LLEECDGHFVDVHGGVGMLLGHGVAAKTADEKRPQLSDASRLVCDINAINELRINC
jgi:hypothetical protein